MFESIQPFGDTAILLTFGSEINLKINKSVMDWVNAIKNANFIGVLEVVPAYASITVHYDFMRVSYKKLEQELSSLVVENVKQDAVKVVEIPVCYDACFSKDMKEVQNFTGLTKQEIITLHTSKDYPVYMLGFLPGFFYLGGMDSKLFCPRKEVPRLKIERGSVGIAGVQTGVYPLDSPGGWQIIGKTPVLVFDKNKEDNCFLVNQGDVVRFYEISLEEFKSYKDD